MVWRLLSRRVSFNFSTWREEKKNRGGMERGYEEERRERGCGRVERGVWGEKRERVKKQKQRGEKEEERMRRGADRGSIYYVIMPHPYPKLHKSPSNCCVSEIFPPKGDGPLPVVLQYWGNPWDKWSKLHSLSPFTKIGVMSGARSPIRDTTLVRTVISTWS